MNKLPLLALLLASCGDDAYTWGDAASAVSEAYCSRLEACNFDFPGCVKDTYFHLCDLPGICGVSVGDDVEVLVASCEADVAVQSCDLLYWGIIPSSCYEVLGAAADAAE